MKFIRKVNRIFESQMPFYRVIMLWLLNKFSDVLDDKLFIRLKYKALVGIWPNLENPRTFSEKLQWLKLYNRNPQYTIMADKIEAKKYVSNIIGSQYIIPTLGVYDSPSEIDFDSLPNKFVIKCNHNSGTGMFICKDKSKINVEKVKSELYRGLKENYYMIGREWPYKNIKRRILIEQFMKDEGHECLMDYKFFCFNGEPCIMYMSRDNANNATTDFFDMEFNHLPIRIKDPNSLELPSKPAKFEEMKELARKLSKGHPHVRVDFYIINNQIYFGELTFFHNAGFVRVKPLEWEFKLGSWIDLNMAYKNQL